MEWGSIPIDVVSIILSFVTCLPIYSRVCKHTRSRENEKMLYLMNRMSKFYPYWYVTIVDYRILNNLLIKDAIQSVPPMPSNPTITREHIFFYIERMAILDEWEYLQVIAYLWQNDLEITEWIIRAVR